MDTATLTTDQFFRLLDKHGSIWIESRANRRLPEVHFGKILMDAAQGNLVYNAEADNRHRAYGFLLFDGTYFSTKRDFHGYREPLLDMLFDYLAAVKDHPETDSRQNREYNQYMNSPSRNKKVMVTGHAVARLENSVVQFSESNPYYSGTLRATKDLVGQPPEFFEAQVAEWLLNLESDGDMEYLYLKRLYEKADRPGNLTISEVIRLLQSVGAQVRPDNDRLYRLGTPQVQASLTALT